MPFIGKNIITTKRAPFSDLKWRFYACIKALDFFDDCTRTVSSWLAHTDKMSCFTFSEKEALFDRAAEAAKEIDALATLRQEPRVAYDAVGDRFYFIFKAENNGDTWIFAQDPIIGLLVDDDE